MSNFKFIRFIEQSGKRKRVLLYNYATSEEVSVDISDLKNAMKNNTVNVEGLILDGTGLKLDTRIKKDSPDNSKLQLQMIQRDLGQIKDMLKTTNTALVPKSNNTELNYATKEDIEYLEDLIKALGRAVGYTHYENQRRFDELSEKLAEQGATFEDYFNKIRTELPNTLKGMVKSSETSYPVDTEAIDYDIIYKDNSDAFSSPESLAEIYNEYNTRLPFVYDEGLFAEIDKHLPIVNNIRKRTASAFKQDIKDDAYAVGEHKDVMNKASGLIEIGMFSLLGCQTSALAAFKILKGGLQTIGGSVVTSFKASFETDGMRINRTRESSDLGLMARQNGIWSTYVSWDLDDLTNNNNLFDSYAIDIRVFVVDMMSAMQKKAKTDMISSKKYSYTDYGKYLKGSMCRCPVDDDTLMRFYCKWYIARKARVGDFYYKNKPNKEDTVKHTVTTCEYLFDAFVNAYFVAKKLCLFDSNGVKCLDFLHTSHLTSESVKKTSAKFLVIVKFALLKQGIESATAEELIRCFAQSNYDQGWLDIYLNSQIYLNNI